jgi:hypothetical protein
MMQAYQPPAWLRNGHLQSYLSSSQLRQRRGAACCASSGW